MEPESKVTAFIKQVEDLHQGSNKEITQRNYTE